MSEDQTIQEQEKGLWERFTDAASDLGNKALLVREGAQQFVAGIPAIPGYLVDLVDMGSEKFIGVDLYEGSAGSYIQEKAKGLIDITDPVKWAGGTPEIKTETDQKIVDYTETTLDVASVVVSLGAATPKLAATGSKILARTSDDIAKAAARAASHTADDAAKAAARTASHTVDDAAEATAKATAHTADDVAEATAKSATGNSPLSLTDRWALRSTKIGMFSTASITGLVVTEFSTNGAISEATAHGMLNVAEALRDIDPELAEMVKEGGLSVLAFGTGLADTPQNAAVNAASVALEEQGYNDAAAALRIANTVSSVSFYTDLIATDQGDRAERFITRLSEDANVDRAQMGRYLQEHPTQRSIIEEQLGVDLTSHFPELAAATAATEQTQTAEQRAAEQQQQTAEAPSVWASLMNSDVSQMGRGLLSTTFDNVRDQVSESNDWSLKMKFAWANVVIGFTSLLSGLPIIGEWAEKWGDEYKKELLQDTQNRLQDMANGDVVGQGSNLMGLVRDMAGFGPEEKPSGPTVRNQPDLALN